MRGSLRMGGNSKTGASRTLAGPLVATLLMSLLPVLALAAPAHAANPTSPPFTECPAVGYDTSCGVLVVINADNSVTVLSDPSQGPFDGIEDTLTGIVNNSSRTVGAIALRSSTDMFGFDGDGICAYGLCFGPFGYEGPNTSFSDISPDLSSGVVNFPSGLAPGSSTYFSLEESLSAANVQSGTGQSPISVFEQGQTPNLREPLTTCSTGQPVNCATGDFWHTFTDIAVPGRGVPIDFTRTYNAGSAAADGPLGHGWTDSYNMSLSTDSSGNVTVNEENGSTVTFSPSGFGTLIAPSRVLATLVQNGDGSYTMTDFGDRNSYAFSPTGQLTAETDRNGYVTSLAYSGGQLASVTDPAGRVLAVTTDGAGHITRLTDPAGRTVAFAYDGAGNLTSATDVAGHAWSFSYDANHLLTAMTDPRGGVTTNVYDAQNRVVSQTDPAGHTTNWSYSGDPTTTAGSTTTITDPAGHVTNHTYSQLQLVTVTRAAGTSAAATWNYSYDPFTLRVSSVTDPDNHTRSYTYDRNGNMLTATDALGRTSRLSYNGFNEPVFVSSPAGATTSFNYDGNANLTSVSRSVGGGQATTTLSYGDSAHPGDITSVTNPNGQASTIGYDANGDVTALTDALGHVTSFTYDGIGRLTSSTTARGKTSSYTLDAYGDLVSATDPVGHVASATYDADRNVVTVTDGDGNKTSYGYDPDNRVTSQTRADGSHLAYSYDAAGNRVAQVDAAGRATSFGYDAQNRVTSVTDPLGRVTAFGYDSAGNRTSMTDPSGQVTTLGYDAANELTGQTYSDGTTPNVTYRYTADGQRASMTDGTGATTYTYDSGDRLTAQTNAAGQTVSYGYDFAGDLTSLTYPNGQTVSRTYDAAQRLTGVTDWLGHTTTFTPDADGNVASIGYANGVSSTQTFDGADELTTITDTLGSNPVASFGYTRDGNGQVTSAASSGVPQSAESYSYDQLNHLLGVNTATYNYDGADNVVKLLNGATLTYDAANEATSYTNAAGTKTPFTYDSRGDRTSTLAPSGKAIGLRYDQANRLTRAGTPGFGSVAGGDFHSLAVKADGTVWTWGANFDGQLGNGNATDSATPVKATNVAGAVEVAGGNGDSAALTGDGRVWTWGNNKYGELANGAVANVSGVPAKVTGLANAVAIAAGGDHMLAATSDGSVWSWGYNKYGELGNGTTTNSSSPVKVTGLTGAVAVAAGQDDSYALKSDGTVWAWGYNVDGELGNGTTNASRTPVQVQGLSGVTGIAAGLQHAFALKSDGSVWAWGFNRDGELGNGTTTTSTSPVQVSGLSQVTAVTGGGYHSLAVRADGTEWGWGLNNHGQIGASTSIVTRPVQLAGVSGAQSVGAGFEHTVTARSDGTVLGLGYNNHGQVGNGKTADATSPVPVTGLTGVSGGAGGVSSSYTYDGDGMRATRTGSGARQTFAWNLVSGVPTMLTDGSASYLYDDSGTPVEQIDAAGTPLYYQHDQYGSTRVLTTSTGAVAASFAYDPAGNLTGKTGAADTPLRWNGQYQDTDTGLYYLRSRYYDPATAQFLTRDPLAALTQQAYAYGNGDPLDQTDPLGLCNSNVISVSFWTGGNCLSGLVGGPDGGGGESIGGVVKSVAGIAGGAAAVTATVATGGLAAGVFAGGTEVATTTLVFDSTGALSEFTFSIDTIASDAEQLAEFAGQVGNWSAAAHAFASCGGAALSGSGWGDCTWDSVAGIVGWASGLWPGGFPGSLIGLLANLPNPFGDTHEGCSQQ